MARSMWNGCLSLGEEEIPVKLYAAIEDAAVHFHLLHDADLTRVQQRWVDSETGEIEETADIKRAYPVQKEEYVVLEDAELDRAAPPASRTVQLDACIPRSAIEPVWYQRPYFVGPHASDAQYFALARALEQEECAVLAHWVMRKRAYHGALWAADGYLMLASLRSREEVLAAPRVKAPPRAFDAREVKLAKQLIDALRGDFEPARLVDEHRQRVLELVAAKVAGKPSPKAEPKPARAQPASLKDALEHSLKAVGKERRSA
jgi:DNA end-binding protein Ku